MRFPVSCLVLLLGGCAVFKESPAYFANVPGLTVAPVHRLQPGDVISAPIPNATNSFASAVLDSQGWVDFPRVGRMYLLGMTYSEADDALADACRAKGILPSIVPGPERTPYYQISGEVRSPGRQLYLSRIRLSQVIQSAGGATKSANLRRIRVQRAGGTIEDYNLLKEAALGPRGVSTGHRGSKKEKALLVIYSTFAAANAPGASGFHSGVSGGASLSVGVGNSGNHRRLVKRRFFMRMRSSAIIVIVCSLFLAACGRHSSSGSSGFQLRLIQDNATAETEAMTTDLSLADPAAKAPETLNVRKKVLLDGRAVGSVIAHPEEWPATIEIILTDEGRKAFAEITRQNIHRRLGIVVGGKLLIAPRIEAEIPDGKVQISGALTPDQADEIAQRIRGGHSHWSDARTYFYAGTKKAAAGDHAGAIADYDRAIQINPNDAKAYNNRGNAKDALNDNTGAIADFTKAIELDPQYQFAYYNRANSEQKIGEYTDAIRDYDKAASLDPQDASVFVGRGITKYLRNDYPAAIGDFTKAIEINSQDGKAYNNRAAAKNHTEDFAGAIADCNRAIELNPRHAEAYNNRGTAKRGLKDFDGAIIDYSKAIEINPQYAKAYTNRAAVEALKREMK